MAAVGGEEALVADRPSLVVLVVVVVGPSLMKMVFAGRTTSSASA